MVVSALVSLLIVAAPIPEGWSTYANDRYGYSPEGKTNLAWHRRTHLERWKKEGVRVTYQPKGKGWWVLSGEDAKGRVHYLKQLEKDGVVYGFEWSHPRGAKQWQDATGAIAKSFKLP